MIGPVNDGSIYIFVGQGQKCLPQKKYGERRDGAGQDYPGIRVDHAQAVHLQKSEIMKSCWGRIISASTAKKTTRFNGNSNLGQRIGHPGGEEHVHETPTAAMTTLLKESGQFMVFHTY